MGLNEKMSLDLLREDAAINASYDVLVKAQNLLTDEEFLSVHRHYLNILKLGPQNQRSALLFPALSFAPVYMQKSSGTDGFLIKVAPDHSISTVVSPEYKEHLFNLYPNIKALYRERASRDGFNESTFWGLVLCAYQDRHTLVSSSNVLLGTSTTDDNAKLAHNIIMGLTSLLQYKASSRAFDALFDINKRHENLLATAAKFTSLRTSSILRTPLDSVIYDYNAGSVMELLPIKVPPSSETSAELILFGGGISTYGVGPSFGDCYSSPLGFIVAREINTCNFLICEQLCGESDIFNLSARRYLTEFSRRVVDIRGGARLEKDQTGASAVMRKPISLSLPSVSLALARPQMKHTSLSHSVFAEASIKRARSFLRNTAKQQSTVTHNTPLGDIFQTVVDSVRYGYDILYADAYADLREDTPLFARRLGKIIDTLYVVDQLIQDRSGELDEKLSTLIEHVDLCRAQLSAVLSSIDGLQY